MGRGRWAYLTLGCLLSGLKAWGFRLQQEVKGTSFKMPASIGLHILRASAEWLVVLGVFGVARQACTGTYRHLPLLTRLAMPFYLTHQQVSGPALLQVLVAVLSGGLWVPGLSSFPATLLLATLATTLLSLLITKLPNARYFFGLPPKQGSVLPGRVCGGLLPVLALALTVTALLTAVSVVANNFDIF